MIFLSLFIFAITFVLYTLYYMIIRHYTRQQIDIFIRKILSSIFYTIVLVMILNINITSATLGFSPDLLNITRAIKNINNFSNTTLNNINIITNISMFIAVFDIIISISSIIIPGFSITFLSLYQPYTHIILSYMEGASKILGFVLLLSYTLRELLIVSKTLKPFLASLSSLVIPAETRALGRGFLTLYIILVIILPYSINTSIKNFEDKSLFKRIDNILNLSFTPVRLYNITVRVATYDELPFSGRGILTLKHGNFTLIATVHDGKKLVVPPGKYISTSFCLYWHNFSNSACCFKKGYTECYNCYITPFLDTNTTSTIKIQIPFHSIPCNKSMGVSGLYQSPQKPFVENGKIVFQLTPQHTRITVKVIGGGFRIFANNNSGWNVYYKLEPIGNYIPTCSNSLDIYYLKSIKWLTRLNLQLYTNWTPKLGVAEASNEYALTVWAERNNSTRFCQNRIIANVTIYGNGCWNPNIAYISTWDVIAKLNRIIKNEYMNFTNYITSMTNIIINTYSIFIVSSGAVAIALNTGLISSIGMRKVLLSLSNKLLFNPIKLIFIRIKTKKTNRNEKLEKKSASILWPSQRRLLTATRKVVEDIRYDILKYKLRSYAENLMKNIDKNMSSNENLLLDILFVFKTPYVWDILPKDAQMVLTSYHRFPVYYQPRFPRKMMHEEIPRAIIKYISARKYGKNVAPTIEYLFNLRNNIIAQIASLPDPYYPYVDEKIRYRRYIEQGILPDLDFMILSLLSRFNPEKIAETGKLSLSRLKEIVTSVLETYAYSNNNLEFDNLRWKDE